MKNFWVAFFIFWPILAVWSFVVAPAKGWWFPGAGLAASPLGRKIDDLFYLILIITGLVFVLTQIAMGYVLWRGSRETDEKAWFTHGSHNLEVLWTIVPAGILLFIALFQLDVWAQFRMKSSFPAEARFPIAEVTARQFEWRIRYPSPETYRSFQSRKDVVDWLNNPRPDDLHDVNELHAPSGKPVLIMLRTQDVQHAFFIPELRVKQDAVPGQAIDVWFQAENTTYDSKYKGQSYYFLCAELCGWGHYKMGGRLIAQPEQEFHAFLEKLRRENLDDGVPEQASANKDRGGR